jgi:ABC-type nickel/cobalt efflux system permease component RcnA
MAINRGILAAAMALCMAALAAPAAANPFGSVEGTSAPRTRAPTSQGRLVGAQRDLRERSAEAVRAFAAEPSAAALAALLLAAFAYGVLHAAGPGHRKTVVFSLFLGKAARAWEPLAAGFLSAGVHAGAGIALVAALSAARGAIASLGDAERVGAWLDAGTFGLLVLASGALMVRKAASLIRGSGHGHPARKGGVYGIIIASSAVPCPGATMLLLFSLYAGLPALGVAGVVAMSLGMGLVISAAGYLAWLGREGLFSRLKSRERLVGTVADVLEALSYAMVLAFSIYMAWPVLTAL